MTTSLYEIYEDGVKERFQAEFVRIGRAEGLEQGRQQGLEVLFTLAETRLGAPLPSSLVDSLTASNLSLKELTQLVVRANTSGELEHLLDHEKPH